MKKIGTLLLILTSSLVNAGDAVHEPKQIVHKVIIDAVEHMQVARYWYRCYKGNTNQAASCTSTKRESYFRLKSDTKQEQLVVTDEGVSFELGLSFRNGNYYPTVDCKHLGLKKPGPVPTSYLLFVDHEIAQCFLNYN